MLEVSLFGGFQVNLNGKAFNGFPSNQTRALFAFLCLEHDQIHLRETIATMLRPNHVEPEARKHLRTTIYRLRKALEQALPEQGERMLVVKRQTIELRIDPNAVTVDVWAFEAAVRLPKSHSLLELEATTQLYQGELLRGFHLNDAKPFEQWLQQQRERLQRQSMQLLTTLAEQAAAESAWDVVRRASQRQLALESWYEPAFQREMVALAKQGDRSSALALYDRCCDVLADELGVPPSPETCLLYTSPSPRDLSTSRMPSSA